MTINPDFLEILRCPFCKAKVAVKADGSGLKCETCHRVYPVRDDIPIMIIEEATIEKDLEA
ncbi:MAG: Trm112 family protein [Blastocatellia bacterium]